jgi:hypothetical protein
MLLAGLHAVEERVRIDDFDSTPVVYVK